MEDQPHTAQHQALPTGTRRLAHIHGCRCGHGSVCRIAALVEDLDTRLACEWLRCRDRALGGEDGGSARGEVRVLRLEGRVETMIFDARHGVVGWEWLVVLLDVRASFSVV